MKCLLALLLCACGTPAPVFAVKADPVRESVGLLDMGEHVCSAVLVAPQVAVTAGHCIVVGASESLLGGELRDGYGRLMGKVIGAAHSDTVDAGLVVLDRKAGPGLEFEPAPPQYGEPLTLAGYGCSDGALGLRRASSAGQIDTDGAFVLRGRVCRGDSGGAILDRRGRLVGIMSAYSTAERFRAYGTLSEDLIALIVAAQRVLREHVQDTPAGG